MSTRLQRRNNGRKEEARKTFESLLEDFVEMQNREQDEDLYEELDNRVY